MPARRKASSSLFHKNNTPPPAPILTVKPLATPAPKPPASALPKDKNALLADAVKAEDTVAVKALLEKGANPNGEFLEHMDLLSWATESDNLQIVTLLLRSGADVNPAVYTSPLSRVARNGNLEMAGLLLRYGADVNPKDHRANVNPRDECSPLAWAMSSGSDCLPMMKLLVRQGADVNARFDKDTTVMSIARFYGNDEAVALLKRHGARR